MASVFHLCFINLKPSCLVNNTKPRSYIEITDYKEFLYTETDGSVQILFQPTTNGSVNRNTSGQGNEKIARMVSFILYSKGRKGVEK